MSRYLDARIEAEALGPFNLQTFDNYFGYLSEFLTEFKEADEALKLTWWRRLFMKVTKRNDLRWRKGKDADGNERMKVGDKAILQIQA